MTALFHTRRRALAIVGVALVALLLLGRMLAGAGAPTAARPRPAPIPVAAPPPAVVIDVVGAVRRPGLYRLRQGERVADAVARAGGTTAKADLELINLAAPIADGEQVVVPRRDAVPAPGGAAAGASVTAGPVHLSTATVEQLDALPGIGPVTAQKIVDYRTRHGAFHSVDELDAIAGIGPAKLEQLRGQVAP